MLAKVAPPSNDFPALARYLVHGKPGTTPHPNRVAWTFTQNLPSDDPALAARCMQATAQASQRTRKAAYHLMIAWHAHERPTPELMQTIARATLTRAGLAEHQALVMGHGDRPHPHLHILLNRVHPDTGRAWKTTHDFARFDRIMRDLAESYGCTYVPAQTYNPELTADQPTKPDTPATYAAKRGAPTNRPQWSRRTTAAMSEVLSEDLTRSSTVDDVEATLAAHGLALEAKGQGFVVGNAHSYAKLSQIILATTAKVSQTLRMAADTFHVRQRQSRPVFTVDAVDMARVFVAMGLIDQDDLRQTIADERLKRLLRRQAPSVLQTVLLSSALSQASALGPQQRAPLGRTKSAPGRR